jgi:methylmalonyl-CoA mutase
MTDKDQKLFNEFPPVTTQEWESKIHADLKGKDYERALVWKTYEGLSVRPYYTSENLEGLDFLDSLPGEFPFVRGNKKTGNDWFIRQNIHVKDFAEANRKALSVLGKGVTSLGFCFDCKTKITKENLAVLLKTSVWKPLKPILNAPATIAAVHKTLKNWHWQNIKMVHKSTALPPLIPLGLLS